ncbi:MAG: hypothetical protein H7239_06145 [Flavobacterium sp.]|nr:hypothetical protein [Flavobacterium sp.]
MKSSILFLFVILASCSKDSSSTLLPPETQVGANTFGVTIKGKVYVPRDPKGTNVGGATPKGMYLTGLYSNNYNYRELIIVDGASSVGFKMTIHIENLSTIGAYPLKQSNFHDQVDSVPFNNIFFKIYDYSISNYAYYGSIENQGEINITKLNGGILSGNFSGKFVRYDNPNEYIQITDGRFDINGFTLPYAVFP